MSLPADPMRWWLPIRRVDRPRVRLVCFPWAGGGAVAFHGWAARLPRDVDLWAAQLPGRGSRFGEPALPSLGALLDALEPAVAPLLDAPCAFFGHSMGAVLAFELAGRLVRAGRTPPVHLFVSAARPPGADRGEPLHVLPDEALLARLAALGGMPEAVMREPELLQLMLPTIRADLTALETWTSPAGPPLPAPITALGGLDDDIARGELEGWRAKTSGAFSARLFWGGHFYLQAQEGAVVDHVTTAL